MRASRLALFLLLGGAVWVGWSCTERSPLEVRTAPRADLWGLTPDLGLLSCTPIAADSVTDTIGPDGGTIQVGPHTLTIPAGALLAPVAITAVAPSDTVNHVQFQPQGLQFLQPASLTLSYANCSILGLPVPRQIAYTTDALVILEYLGSLDDPRNQTVTASIHHFSEYAVAW
jgi:hypothetical protein